MRSPRRTDGTSVWHARVENETQRDGGEKTVILEVLPDMASKIVVFHMDSLHISQAIRKDPETSETDGETAVYRRLHSSPKSGANVEARRLGDVPNETLVDWEAEVGELAWSR